MSNRLLAAARQNPRTALSSIALWYRGVAMPACSTSSRATAYLPPLGDIARVCSRRGYCR